MGRFTRKKDPERKRKSRRIRIIALAVLLAWITWRNVEYAWANKLVEEVRESNDAAVEEILERNIIFSVNRAAGSPFFIRWIPECGPERPLIVACENDDLKMVELLLRYGADPNAHFLEDTALNTTVANLGKKDLEIAKTLLEHGADPDRSPLLGYGNPALLLIADHPADSRETSALILDLYQLVYPYADVKWPVNRMTKKTPLHYAASMGNEDLIQFLLEQPETVVEARDRDGRTAYDIAARVQEEDTETLLKNARGKH